MTNQAIVEQRERQGVPPNDWRATGYFRCTCGEVMVRGSWTDEYWKHLVRFYHLRRGHRVVVLPLKLGRCVNCHHGHVNDVGKDVEPLMRPKLYYQTPFEQRQCRECSCAHEVRLMLAEKRAAERHDWVER